MVSHPNQFKGKARVTLSLEQKQQPGQEVCLQEQVSKIQARREDPLAHYHLLCISHKYKRHNWRTGDSRGDCALSSQPA